MRSTKAGPRRRDAVQESPAEVPQLDQDLGSGIVIFWVLLLPLTTITIILRRAARLCRPLPSLWLGAVEATELP